MLNGPWGGFRSKLSKGGNSPQTPTHTKEKFYASIVTYMLISMQYPEGHTSKSIYTIFKLVSAPQTSNGLFEEFFPDLCVAVWTTTPWTIPANAGKT